MSDDPEPANRMARESSPYLLQHAHNPVNWYPWGEEAHARARREDKPILLSIGYSSCHWCHVMERESFSDQATADILNANFVAIKVDREERPDLDAVYLAAVQAITGSAGWPLNVFLTPKLEPFFGGTYFPSEHRYGMPSFREVLLAIADTWKNRRAEIDAKAKAFLRRVEPRSAVDVQLDFEVLERRVMAQLHGQFDREWGGFGAAPKFPSPARLFFLLHRARRHEPATRLLGVTLDSMAAGGLFDWLGGGFHRYSVDERWLVPHFEKMLYDNALLARVYGEAGLALDSSRWLAIARAVSEYLLAEMQGPEGGFYSATDADSDGEEGRFFTWTADEVREVLAAEEAKVIVTLCDLDAPGSLDGGRNVLRPGRSAFEIAAAAGQSEDVVHKLVLQAKRDLLAARARRIPPSCDDKRIAGWNGMAIWALGYLGAVLPEPRYLEAASNSARFLLESRDTEGRLARAWRNGVASGVETLEDVAWVAAGLIQLFESTGEAEWLSATNELVDRRLAAYQDEDGLLYDAAAGSNDLIVRPHNPFDGAAPSSVAVMIESLRRLSALTDEQRWRQAGEKALHAEARNLARSPEGCLSLVEAAVSLNEPPSSVVIIGDPVAPATRALVETAWRNKRAACVVARSASPVPPLTLAIAPLLAAREAGESSRAWVCQGAACEPPTSDPQRLAALLRA